MLGEHPGSLGIGVLSKWKQTKNSPFHHIKQFLHSYDVVIGNLECVLSNTTIRSGYRGLSLRAPPLLSKIIAKNGFHVLSVANNHSMDHGYDAFEETVTSLQSAGILVCGTKQDPVRLEVNNPIDSKKRTIAFFGASFRPNDTNLEPCYPLISDEVEFENLKSLIEKESANSDLVVVQCHWGDEFISLPSLDQHRWAEELVAVGADIVVGHHSHVYQGLQMISDRPVFFSLGNFVSDMQEKYLRRSAVASIIWDGLHLSSNSLPIRLNRYHQPILTTETADYNFIKRVDSQCRVINPMKYSAYYQHILRKAKLRYRFDSLLNLVKHLGINSKYKIHLVRDTLQKLSGSTY